MKIPHLFQSLQNLVFAKLYAAQVVNLIGDALSWLGLALLAFEIAGEKSGIVLATALTLRVSAFVILSPIAGLIADRYDRQRLMITTHILRMVLVCLLPYVTQIGQLYGIVLALNMAAAFFTPTFTATIPLVTTEAERQKAIALSSTTYQLLGVLGPGFAGSIAAWVGTRQIFFFDGITFLISAIILTTISESLTVPQSIGPKNVQNILKDLRTGTVCLWSDPSMRYALLIQLIAAIAGAQILVNTVHHIQGNLQLGKVAYGAAMATFGIGSTLASLGVLNLTGFRTKSWIITFGAGLITGAIAPANAANFTSLLMLWLLAGIGQVMVNLPTQMLIADRVAIEIQGRVYGAHFAWSHLWWAFAYPIAGGLGSRWPEQNFFYSGVTGLIAVLGIYLLFAPRSIAQSSPGIWHEHQHSHDSAHHHNNDAPIPNDHDHDHAIANQSVHHHLHFHPMP
jgi:MFS transporter, NRE family, putaive nickel resistance protein